VDYHKPSFFLYMFNLLKLMRITCVLVLKWDPVLHDCVVDGGALFVVLCIFRLLIITLRKLNQYYKLKSPTHSNIKSLI